MALSSSSSRPVLRGIIFDMDGTLTIPNLDFKEMYMRCGVDGSEDLLAAVAAMPEAQATAARAVIDEMEAEGRRTLTLAPGVTEMARWLHAHDIRTALVTRNTAETVHALENNLWKPAGLRPFAPALARDTHPELPAKPDPASLTFIAEEWGVDLPTDDLIMVGDSPSNDVSCGKAARISTALVDSGRRFLEGAGSGGADMRVDSLAFLPRLLWQRYHIGGPLGTDAPLLKYPQPCPTSRASVAATEGDLGTLRSLSLKELNALDDDVSEEGGGSNTPLIWASDAGHADAVEMLVAKGVDVDVRGYLGATACSRASRKGHADVLHALLGKAPNLDIPNIKMQYPLHFAAFKKNRACVDILLAHGANPLVLDRKGRTPAEDTSDPDIRQVLMAANHAALRKEGQGVLDSK